MYNVWHVYRGERYILLRGLTKQAAEAQAAALQWAGDKAGVEPA